MKGDCVMIVLRMRARWGPPLSEFERWIPSPGPTGAEFLIVHDEAEGEGEFGRGPLAGQASEAVR